MRVRFKNANFGLNHLKALGKINFTKIHEHCELPFIGLGDFFVLCSGKVLKFVNTKILFLVV